MLCKVVHNQDSILSQTSIVLFLLMLDAGQLKCTYTVMVESIEYYIKEAVFNKRA